MLAIGSPAALRFLEKNCFKLKCTTLLLSSGKDFSVQKRYSLVTSDQYSPVRMRRISLGSALILLIWVLLAGAQLPSNGPVTYAYDELGRLVGVVAATGESARYSYDAVGNILSITRYGPTDLALFTFSPKSGPAGTNVTIFGSNFSADVAQNSVTFNGAAAIVTSASTTQLQVTVPVGASTGLISISSPSGTLASTDPFTVTPAGQLPTITSFTPNIVAPGTAVSVTGQNFDTSAQNDRLIVNTTHAAQPTAVTSTSLNFVTPVATASGHISLSTPGGAATSNGDLFIPPSPFTVSQVGYTGRTTTGTATTVSTAAANKIGMLLFDGAAGQSVSISAGSGTFSSCTFQLYKPDNRTIGASGGCTASGGFLDEIELPVSGTYTVIFNASNGSSGSVVATVNEFPGDVNGGTISVGGPPVTAQNLFPGQNVKFTFSAAANQHISFLFVSSTFTTCNLTLYEPPPTLLPGVLGPSFGAADSCGKLATFSDVAPLPVSGTYTIVVDPHATEVGSVTFKVIDSTDLVASIAPDGPPVTATTTNPGQNIRLNFNGTTGQVVAAAFTNNSYAHGVGISLLDPGGNTVKLTSAGANANAFLDPANYCNGGAYPCSQAALPSNGIYTLLIDPSGADVGSIQTTLYNVPADQVSTVDLAGTPVSVGLNSYGQNARFSFSGQQSQKLSFNMTGATFSGTIGQGCHISVISPSGTNVTGSQNCYVATAFFDSWALPSTGTYILAVDPLGNTVGGATLQLYDDTDVNMPITANGTSYTVSTTVPGQNASLTFSGTAGQRVFGVIDNITGYTGLNSQFVQLQRNGSALIFGTADGATFDVCASGCTVETLPATDSYAIFLNPNGAGVGSARVTVFTVPSDFSGVLTSGTPLTLTTTTPGQNAQLTFSANAGQSLTSVALSGGTYPSSRCLMNIKRPDGTSVASSLDCSGTSHSFGPYSLNQTGTYTISIDPQFAGTGNVTVTANVN